MKNGPIIVTKDLCKDFGKTRAINNLNMQVNRGELFGIVGPDGAGKTTTLRILAGIMEPSSGEAWIDGISVSDNPEAIKEHVAYMPQRFGLYADLTVLENLIFYADLFRVPKKVRPSRLEKLFGFSRLGPFKDRLAGALSGGMKQKLGLACALIHEPRLLLLDEPTNGVDPVSRRDFWRILYDLLQEGISMVVSTAYLDEAERTNRVGLMYGGSMIIAEEPQVLKDMVEGAMFELMSTDISRAREISRRVPGVLDVNIFGEGLHIRVRNDQDAQAILEKLKTESVEVISMRRIAPAMEDAFLSLIPKS